MQDFGPFLSRRYVLFGLGGIGAVLTADALKLYAAHAAQVAPGQKLKPGDYTWTPDTSPSGQVAILVSLRDQLVTVYRGGSVIATSTCSSGRPGHVTPTGTFTILQKARTHYSSTYNEAPMPNMERLTWSGIALHAGNLPGYPASHGCVRLPMEFSALLFTVTHVGTTVTISDSHTPPAVVNHPGMVLAKYDPSENGSVTTALKAATPSATRQIAAAPVPRDNPTPEAKSAEEEPLLAVVISSASQQIAVFDHDQVVAEGKAYIQDPQAKLGSHVFVLAGSDKNGLVWHDFTYAAAPGGVISQPEANLLRRITGDPTVIDAMKARMHVGMVLVTTDDPITPDTFTKGGFSILTNEA